MPVPLDELQYAMSRAHVVHGTLVVVPQEDKWQRMFDMGNGTSKPSSTASHPPSQHPSSRALQRRIDH